MTRLRLAALYLFLGAWTLTFLRAIDHALAVASWCGR
jgi:ABC-type transport system involved in cytochrome c biogenesis permease component